MEDPAMQAMQTAFPADTNPMIFGGFAAILQA